MSSYGFKCYTCGERLPNRDELFKHKRLVHQTGYGKANVYRCPYCTGFKGTMFEESLIHVQQVHPERLLKQPGGSSKDVPEKCVKRKLPEATVSTPVTSLSVTSSPKVKKLRVEAEFEDDIGEEPDIHIYDPSDISAEGSRKVVDSSKSKHSRVGIVFDTPPEIRRIMQDDLLKTDLELSPLAPGVVFSSPVRVDNYKSPKGNLLPFSPLKQGEVKGAETPLSYTESLGEMDSTAATIVMDHEIIEDRDTSVPASANGQLAGILSKVELLPGVSIGVQTVVVLSTTGTQTGSRGVGHCTAQCQTDSPIRIKESSVGVQTGSLGSMRHHVFCQTARTVDHNATEGHAEEVVTLVKSSQTDLVCVDTAMQTVPVDVVNTGVQVVEEELQGKTRPSEESYSPSRPSYGAGAVSSQGSSTEAANLQHRHTYRVLTHPDGTEERVYQSEWFFVCSEYACCRHMKH